MSAQHEHKAYKDNPADSLAHGYPSCDAASMALRAAIRTATSDAKRSLLARVAVAL